MSLGDLKPSNAESSDTVDVAGELVLVPLEEAAHTEEKEGHE